MAVAIGQITLTDVLDGAKYVEEYASNTSLTVAPTTGWNSSVPAPQTGYFIWKRQRLSYADGTFGTYETPIRITGEKGIQGIQGVQGIQGIRGPDGADGQSLYTWVAYANDASGGGISASSTGKTYIGFAYNKTTSTVTLTAGLFTWAKIEGPQGTTGSTGATLYTWLKYADTPTTGMSDSATGKAYIGLAYNKTTSTESTSYGDYTWSLVKGDKGDTGDNGVSISSVTEYYLASSASTGILNTNASFTTTMQTLTVTNKYLWNYKKIVYSNSTESKTLAVIVGVYGNTGSKGATGSTGATGATGRAIVSIVQKYLATSASSGVTTGTSGWTTTMQTTTSTNKYLWNYGTITWSSGTITTYIDPIIIGTYGDKGDTGSTGAKGDKGDTGATGPSGTPGFLGLLVNGSTLTLKGFDANGDLTASVGYIYIDGQRYSVPQYSETFNNGAGQGYILYNPNWASPVRYAKMIADTSSIVYKDYETLAVLDSTAYVIGQFQRESGVIFNAKIINPETTENFQTSNFMQILASGEMNDVNKWVQALNVQQAFRSIAVLQAFVDELIANKLRVGGGSELSGFLFKAEIVDGVATIAAYYNGQRTFFIDGATGAVEMAGTGKFLGLIDSEPFLTQPYVQGATIPSTPSKTLWSTDELYSELTTIPEGETIQSASGSYDGKTINGITRLANGSRAVFSTYTDSNEYAESGGSGGRFTMIGNFIIPSGCSYVDVKASVKRSIGADYPSNLNITKNGDNIPVGTHARIDSYNVGTIISQQPIGYTTTFGQQGSSFSVASTDRILVYLSAGINTDNASSNGITIKFYHSLTGKGTFLRYSDSTYALIAENQRRNDVLTLTSPSWATSGNLNFISGTTFYNAFSTLTLGISTPCSGSVTVNGGGYTNVTVNPIFVTRNTDGITFQTASGYVVILKWGGQGSLIGVYTSLSCSITLVGQLSAIRFKNAIPFDGGSATIGQGSNRISAYFGTNADITTINSAGTSNNVYGAVFN